MRHEDAVYLTCDWPPGCDARSDNPRRWGGWGEVELRLSGGHVTSGTSRLDLCPDHWRHYVTLYGGRSAKKLLEVVCR
jgi:hypothetical protein